MVDRWCDPRWEETHNACGERRSLMPGVPHHQGIHSLSGYASTWSASHGWLALLLVQGICFGSQGQGDVLRRLQLGGPARGVQQPECPQPPQECKSMARSVFSPDYNSSTEDLHGELAMRVGRGKKHGWYWLGDSVLDTAATPTLSAIRARSMNASLAIRPRPDTEQH